MSDSEDTEVRCRSCGRYMGNITARSESSLDLSSIVWMNKFRIRCMSCSKASQQTTRTFKTSGRS